MCSCGGAVHKGVLVHLLYECRTPGRGFNSHPVAVVVGRTGRVPVFGIQVIYEEKTQSH